MWLLLYGRLGCAYALCFNSDITWGWGEAPNYSQLLTHNHTFLVVISPKKKIYGIFA